MSITRIKNNQITDLTVNAAAKLQDYSITSGKIANNLTYNSDFTVTGNLTVSGNTTTVDTVNLVVEDPLILLAKEQTGSPTLDIGFIGKRGTETNIAFVWDESVGEFVTAFTTSENTNTTITINSYASLKSHNFTANGNITVNGTSDFNGNITLGNIQFDSGSNVNIGNNRVQNVAEPVANSDAATKFYVDSITSSGFTIQDDTANTTIVSAGDTVQFLGTSDQVSVLITDVDQLTFALPSNISVSGTVTGGNIATGGTVSATGNITGGNIATGGTVSATGTGTFGNVATGGTVSATGTATVGNLATAGTVSATANITGGNILTGGIVSAFGNIYADTIFANVSGATSAPGANTDVLFNDAGNSNATAGFTFDKSANLVTVTGNIVGGNLSTVGLVTATGNVTGGNVNTAGLVSAGGNVIAAGVITPLITTSSGDLTLSSAGGALQWDGAGNIVMNSQWINNLSDPVQAQDAATKEYVDNAVSTGITIHTPVYVESPTPLAATYAQGGTTATVTDTIAGNTVVFSAAINPQVNDQLWFTSSFSGIVANVAYFVVSAPNTSAAVLSTTYNGAPVSNISNATGLTQAVRINSGVGATLTGNANGQLTVDGINPAVTDRVLVYTQTTGYENGVYVVTDTGNVSAPFILTRSSDTNTYGPEDINRLDAGDYFFVQAGNTGAGESYVMTAPIGPFIIGYNSLTFTQFSASSTYSANTAAGLVLNGTIFSAKVDNDTTAFDGNGNIVVKAGANLTTPNIGAATGTSLSLTGNVTANFVSATGNVVGGNITTGGAVSATGTGTFGDVNTGGNVSATGTVTGGTLSSVGTATVGNLATAGTVSATGNITGGNLAAGTGNITGGNVSVTGNVTAANFIGTFSGNVDAAGNVNEVQFNGTGDILSASANFTFDPATSLLTVTGNMSATSTVTAAVVSASGNVTGGNLVTGGIATVTGTVTAGNVATGGTVSATGNITGGNIITAGSSDLGNIRISGDDITGVGATVTFNNAGSDVNFQFKGDTDSNLLFLDAGTDTVNIGTGTAIIGAKLNIASTDSMVVPVGNLVQRPGTPVTGMFRFSTTDDMLEVYTSMGWEAVGAPTFTIVVADEFTGDGSTLTFTLTEPSTTASTVVSINGVVQLPTTAYAVVGNALTFTEAPLSTDKIDARILTTTTEVVGISNTSGNAAVRPSATAATVDITGNLVPVANVTYDLGSATNYWRDLYLSGNTITLGNIKLSASAGGLAVTTSAGQPTAVDTPTIKNGTSNVSVVANGNVTMSVAGTANVVTVSSTGATITGDLTVTGNATITGNVATNQISNGTSAVQIPSLSGNVNIDVGAVDNMTVFASTGMFVTGNISATGDVVAQNVNSLSDAVLKTNINPLTGVTSVINRLVGVEYDWKNGAGHSYGFLAQDVEKILPSAVKTGADGMKSINYQMIIPFLVETIKQLGAEVADLKKKLD